MLFGDELIRRFPVGRLAALLIMLAGAGVELTRGQESSSTGSIKRNELATIQVCRDSVGFIHAIQLFGPLLAPASAKETRERRSLGGYYYRLLTKQGRHAPGGAKNYVVKGRMTGGFALLAYPAEYGSSGVMTFVVNRHGVVHQKDLGPDTASLAKNITEYDPDPSWKKVPRLRKNTRTSAGL